MVADQFDFISQSRPSDNGLAAPELPICPKAEKLALSRTFAHSFSSTPGPAPAPVPARPPVDPIAPPQSSDGSPIRFKDRKKRQIGFKKLGCGNNANFCEEEQVCAYLSKSLETFRPIKTHNFCLPAQDYPDTLVRSALRQHPVMSDSLFQQLFASRCKVPRNLPDPRPSVPSSPPTTLSASPRPNTRYNLCKTGKCAELTMTKVCTARLIAWLAREIFQNSTCVFEISVTQSVPKIVFLLTNIKHIKVT